LGKETMVERGTGEWSEEENKLFEVLVMLFGTDQAAISMLLQSRPDKTVKSRIHRIKNHEQRPNGVVQKRFGHLIDTLNRENHNTFSDYLIFVFLKRPNELTQDEAEQKYLSYLSTCVQGFREEGETDVSWMERKKAGRFYYKKY
jgi:hypothetical protein